MNKVVVIDDEPIVRKGIVNIINWQSMNCVISGEAQNGLEGLELINRVQPDIILTDIHMPEIDGLEMIRQVRKTIPWVKIIVLTGYRDFDYIQEALKLGASEFLLKPSKIDEITAAVKKACIELDYVRRRSENFEVLEEHYRKALPLLKEKLLFDIIFSNDSESIGDELKLYDIEMKEFVMISVDLNHADHVDIYQKQLYKIGIKNAFMEIFSENYKCESVNITQSRLLFIIQSETNHALGEDVHKKAENFQLVIKSCFDIQMTLGISTVGFGEQELGAKMRECEHALAYKLYLGEDALILYKDIKHLKSIHENHSLKSLETDLVSSVQLGHEQLFEKLAPKLLEYHKLYTEVWTLPYKQLMLQITENNQNAKLEQLEKLDLDASHALLCEVARKTIQENQTKNRHNLSQILKQSLDYIQENYHDSIALQDLADYTYVSTFYLSRMFKKEIGKNFVDYLNEYRINQSKRYLEDIELKTYEVATLVGISDPHYFSKLFKKYTGQTPTEFRQSL